MRRPTRTHITEDGGKDPLLLPEHMTKEAFANRLYKLMTRKGWNQSELARRAGVTRDSVSTYVTGKSLPTPISLQKLATALGVKPEELLPNYVESAVDADTPSFELRVSPNSPTTAWLRINRWVTLATGVKIAELLQNDNVTSDGS